jgi:aspartate dehydrogenase
VAGTDGHEDSPPRRIHRVAIAGLGVVGATVARHLDAGVPGIELTAVGEADEARATALIAELKNPPRLCALDELEAYADVVVECAPVAILPQVVRPFLEHGKKAIILSSGGLLTHPELVEIAREHGGQILIPSGALVGLDAVTAAAEGTIHSVKMVTRKPPRGLVGAPHLVENRIDVSDITEPMLVFRGSPRGAIEGFPANLNVAVSLGLAGIGPDATQLEIWADPAMERNTHRIEVDADSARLTMTIENVPSSNPRTGLITALSVVAMLRRFEAPLRVG